MHKSDEVSDKRRAAQAVAVVAFLVGMVSCNRVGAPSNAEPTVLRIGFGLTSGQSAVGGIQQAIRIIALEGLIVYGSDGRPQPGLAESWSRSDDGLHLRIRLKPDVKFHDGRKVTSQIVRDVLLQQLPDYIGPAFADIETINAVSDIELELILKRRSNFVLEGLDLALQAPGTDPVGTGPFVAVRNDENLVEMRANDQYHEGRPLIDRLVIKTYSSVRSAWAEMLRGEVDVLYEVGADALDSLQPSTDTKVYTFPRRYAYVVILNVARPRFSNPAVRRALNASIDRDALVKSVFNGHAIPADGPVWPSHWAYDPTLPLFQYKPAAIPAIKSDSALTFLFPDASLERLAMSVQAQLQTVGVNLQPQLVPLDKLYERIGAGDFDALLADARLAQTLMRPALFWHSNGPLNWGHYKNAAVDAALDAIRSAPDDAAYKAGVAAFQRAIVEDPPAIFLAWSERARAVSTRFDVPVEPGRDILSTLRLWRPVADQRMRSPN